MHNLMQVVRLLWVLMLMQVGLNLWLWVWVHLQMVAVQLPLAVVCRKAHYKVRLLTVMVLFPLVLIQRHYQRVRFQWVVMQLRKRVRLLLVLMLMVMVRVLWRLVVLIQLTTQKPTVKARLRLVAMPQPKRLF